MADFAVRLKELRKAKKLRQVDLARDMGVAQTTIANYEQHSRFPDEETLRGIANYFDVTLDYLLGRSDINVSNKDLPAPWPFAAPDESELIPLARTYMRLLLDDKKIEAYNAVVEAVQKGMKVKDVYAEVFDPTLKVVGKLWEINEIDVAKEHFFSEATESLMNQLYRFLAQPPQRKGTIVSVAVNGEYHHLGLKMVTDILEEQGWKSYYLGVNAPTASLVQAINSRKADILAISATMPFNVDSVANMIMHIRSATHSDNLKIIVGGQAFKMDSNLWKRIGADGYASDIQQAVDLVHDLLDD